jgi:hypothetical protein
MSEQDTNDSQLHTQEEQEPYHRLGPMMSDPGERDDGLESFSLPQIMATSTTSGAIQCRRSPTLPLIPMHVFTCIRMLLERQASYAPRFGEFYHLGFDPDCNSQLGTYCEGSGQGPGKQRINRRLFVSFINSEVTGPTSFGSGIYCSSTSSTSWSVSVSACTVCT